MSAYLYGNGTYMRSSPITGLVILPAVSITILLTFVGSSPAPESKRAPQTPNIVLIVADDLGYSDLASYGNSRIHTPNIDSLGSGGIRFTRAYVTSPICSPSRVGIMTGRYQNRFGSEFMPYDNFDPAFFSHLRSHFFSMREKNPGLKDLHPDLFLNKSKYHTDLPENELTMAELLKKSNYTTGLVGKWNMGEDDGNHPYQRGYDYSYYFDGALTRYVDDPVDTTRYVDKHLPWSFSDVVAWAPRGVSTAIKEGRDSVVKDTGYLTFSLAQKGVEFIEHNKDHPFFLTLTFNAPHDPFQAPKSYFDKITSTQDTVKRVYYAMIEALDDAVGQITAELRNAGVADNTMIVFLSDNGGATYTRATDNAPLRGGKCTHFEGGLLVPFFIKYAGLKAAAPIYDKPISSLDIFATVAAATQTPLPTDRQYDGVNLLPYLAASPNPGFPHQTFYWRSGYSQAICKGDWKLYINKKSKKTFLFNLSTDIEEKHDLSAANHEKVKELLDDLGTWEKTQTIEPAWPSAADVSIYIDGEEYYFPT